MQFEEFDKKIMEAADHHHPAYDEQAWAKMHKLLDKHLPEKEKKRRRFIWLFFAGFLLAGTGIFITVNSLILKEHKPITAASAITRPENRTAPDKPVDVETKTKPVETDVAAASHAAAAPQQGTAEPGILPTDKPSAVNLKEQGLTKLQTSAAPVNTKTVQPTTAGNKVITSFTQRKVAGKNKKPGQQLTTPKIVSTAEPLNDFVATTIPSSDKQPDAAPAGIQSKTTVIPPATPGDHTDTVTVLAAVQPAKGSDSAVQENKSVAAVNKKATSKKKSQFFLTLSAGPDASFTPSGKPGRIIPVTGAGIGYNYKGRVSIRAGFYNANKVYTAAPDAYNPPPNFYNYYPYLQKVDASCRVYEIPVSVGYHFGQSEKQGWFVSASLSSYIMKRETYNYYYKTSAWGALQNRVSNYRNKNEHIFTVLGFSGGYQRKITDRISLIAEPYLRIPATGVGYGKVKLNSTGILFSLAVQPAAFVPRKQKR